MTSFSFAHVSHQYSEFPAVEDLSINVQSGETLCLLGPSGSGKTTSLRLLAGIDAPTKGEIYINETLVSSPDYLLPLERRGIGFLFQDYALFPHLTVMDNVTFGLANPKSQAAKQKAINMLSAAGVLDYADKYPDQLSGGEQQRVALARALAPEPSLMLLDEPFSSLDIGLRESMRVLTLKLLKQVQSTNVIVTHDPEDALFLADRIAVMHEGRMIQCDSAETIYHHPKSLNVAIALGSINSCKYNEIEDISKGIEGVSDTQIIAVRPNAIRVSPASKQKHIALSAKLTQTRLIGHVYHSLLELSPLHTWEILTNEAISPEQNEFYIAQNDLMIFDN